jgi:uncharacterized protein (DUF885 family)
VVKAKHVKHFSFAALALGALAPACASNEPVQTPKAPPPAVVTPEPAAPARVDPYSALWAEFLNEYLRREPVEATELGAHEHDGEWPDLTSAGREDTLRFYARIRERLQAIPPAELRADERLDAEVLSRRLDWMTFEEVELRREETDPLLYASVLAAGLDAFVTREYAPPSVRAASLARRLAGIPAFVRVAMTRLGRPARISTETASRQVKGLLGLVDGGFPELLALAPEKRTDVLTAAVAASRSLHELEAFLQNELLPRSDGSFRVGKERFAKILHLTLDPDVDPEELVLRARKTLAEAEDEMALVAKELWPELMGKAPSPDASTPKGKKALIRRVLDKLAEDHPTNATIVSDAAKVLAEETDFVRSHDLVSLPSQPCRVMELPEYRRGVAIAYCDWAGPLETHGETHVSISPVPADWTAARAASFYREYDASMLADLLVHEAMPGHYLQGAHAAELHSAARAVFTNDAFVEGWAVYAEWLMANYGFGGPRVRLQRLKMLARVAANTLLDHEIHAGTMEEKAALDLMENEAYQEEGEAVGKWTRARVSHGQLSQYLYGFTELFKLRSDASRRPGFSERAFHDEILSFGAPSVHELRASMRL